MSVHVAGPIAYLEGSQSAVYFSKTPSTAGAFPSSDKGTYLPIRQLQNQINIAYWGEDNRFPQNIEQQMAYCGVGKSALDWKARALWGAGIIPGKVIDYTDEGKTEVFQPLDVNKYKPVYDFIRNRSFHRFFLEFLQDWTWFFNCFPELILSKDCKSITGFVHQESCDSRYQKMDENGRIQNVWLSKLWGMGSDQYARFDPKKAIRGLVLNPNDPSIVPTQFVKQVRCVDMYDSLASLTSIAKQESGKGPDELKSAILPVNYPSPNKTYYQVPYWDGARLAGWVEIAIKIPSLIKILYSKAFSIKFHIEVPESYFERTYGFEAWHGKKEDEQQNARKALLQQMDDFLSGDENAYKSFISFFDVDPVTKKEYGQIKINPIEDKVNLDKEMITSSMADTQILIAMQAHPTLFGAGTIGTGTQRTGGSDIREAFLVYNAQLNLERNVFLEPLYLVRDFNREVGGMSEWEDDIVFRVRDTVLTTLDTGAGTTKTVS
jgi:hypothetical protein